MAITFRDNDEARAWDAYACAALQLQAHLEGLQTPAWDIADVLLSARRERTREVPTSCVPRPVPGDGTDYDGR